MRCGQWCRTVASCWVSEALQWMMDDLSWYFRQDHKAGIPHIVVQRPQHAPHATSQVCSIPREGGMLMAQCPYDPVEPVLGYQQVQRGELVMDFEGTRTAGEEGTQSLQYVFAQALPSPGCIRQEQSHT